MAEKVRADGKLAPIYAGGTRLFLTDVDYVSFEKANETRQNNLQSATVSLQVVIGLCKRKETAALISQNRR